MVRSEKSGDQIEVTYNFSHQFNDAKDQRELNKQNLITEVHDEGIYLN